MQSTKPGERIDRAPLLSELEFSQFRMRVATDRYFCDEFQQQEKARVWMRVWQVAGRCDEIPDSGDWLEYCIFDQSFVIVRGRDEKIRGFVNACRHRGNALCEGKGRAARLVCPYHKWSYDLNGDLLGVPRPDFDGSIEEFVGVQNELGLIEVPVACFAGFIFLNPDRDSAPLADFLGDIADLLDVYHLEEMVPCGLNVRESLNCNWKVVMDAFQEGYHIQGIHPELIPSMDESRERYEFIGDHSVATAPFGASNLKDISLEQQVQAIRELPATFPGVADALPGFEQLLNAARSQNGEPEFPANTSPRTLLQRAMRENLTRRGLDVSKLTDAQMTDNQFYLLFPNFFLTIHAGEGTFIASVPHPDGDPNRCIWHVVNFQWFPPEERMEKRTGLVEIGKEDHFDYFLALEQDYVQMQRQQKGLRNTSLDYMTLSRQEVRLAHFHAVIDKYMGSATSE